MGRAAFLAGDHQEAEARLTSALNAYLHMHAKDKDVGRCAMALAFVHSHTGRYRTALELLGRAHTAASHSGQLRLLTEIEIETGAVLSASGRYAAARAALARAMAAAEQEDLQASCHNNLGTVFTHIGRHDDAADAYQAAAQIYASLDDELNQAICLMNLGIAYSASSLHTTDEAMETLRSARHLLAGRRPDVAALCTLNIGAHLQSSGAYDDAEAAYLSARATCLSTPGQLANAARCMLSLGGLYTKWTPPRRHDAIRELRNARRLYRQLELDEWAARCTVHLAEALVGDDLGGAASQTRLLEELIPATMKLDAARFQFATSVDRIAWTATTAYAARLALSMAFDAADHRLVAELIESTINSGVHTVTTDVANPAITSTSPDRLVEAGSDGANSASSLRLLAESVLPMVPPPPLRMSDTTVALVKYRRLARRLYNLDNEVCVVGHGRNVTVSTW